MESFLLGTLSAAAMLLAIGLQRTYYHYPVKELRRQARHGDHLAQLLYRPVSYGASLQVLLWSIVIASATISFVLLSRSLEPWFASVVIGLLIWLGFLWLPASRLTGISVTLAQILTPLLNRLLMRLHKPLTAVGNFIRRHRHPSFRTSLYEKEDLFDLLEEQRQLPDNRIPEDEIDMLQHVLVFGDKLVNDALIPLRSVKLVSVGDPIGPSLMDELYKSGHSRFPVYDGEQTNIVATLYLRDLVGKKDSGHVRDVMRKDVFYVHEDFSLRQALQAFLKTKHHMFIVVNSFEEFVGVITIEDILEQVIGQPIVDEFDKYEDVRAVAAATAQEEHEERVETEAEPADLTADGESSQEMVK